MKDIEKITKAWKQPKGQTYKYKTTDYCMNIISDKECVVHIKESGDPKKEPVDWIRNFMGLPVYKKLGPEVKLFVHKGFHEAFLELKEALLPRIEKYEKITIWGISHGAGVSLLLYVYLKLNTNKEIIMDYLFAKPKVFSFLWYPGYKKVKELCRDIISIRISNDIVPRLPFTWMGYGRVCQEIQLESKIKKETLKDKVLGPFLEHGEYASYFREEK